MFARLIVYRAAPRRSRCISTLSSVRIVLPVSLFVRSQQSFLPKRCLPNGTPSFKRMPISFPARAYDKVENRKPPLFHQRRLLLSALLMVNGNSSCCELTSFCLPEI